MTTKLSHLNACPAAEFVAVCGPFFEHSPWIAERTAERRPFVDRTMLHAALVATMHAAKVEEHLQLMNAHPDLVGRAALAGELTAESTAEQKSAGLGELSADERRTFQSLNQAYRDKFGFPFIICARENKKDAILAGFAARQGNSAEQEIRTALAEIAKIARLRLLDAVEES